MSINRNIWNEEEIKQLIKAVEIHGTPKGILLAAHLLGRSKGACAQKYYTEKAKAGTVVGELTVNPIVKEVASYKNFIELDIKSVEFDVDRMKLRLGF